MTKKMTITIEGENLQEDHDGDWTVTLLVDGKLSAQTGLSGLPLHAIAAAHDLAIENGFIEEPDNG